MDFAMVGKLPAVFWLVFAALLIVPVKLPRFGVVVGVITGVPGIALMFDTGARWVAMFNQIGTLLFLLASLWTLAAAIGLSLEKRRDYPPAGGVAASDSVASTTRFRPARFAA